MFVLYCVVFSITLKEIRNIYIYYQVGEGVQVHLGRGVGNVLLICWGGSEIITIWIWSRWRGGGQHFLGIRGGGVRIQFS